jgi:hypothetical protein
MIQNQPINLSHTDLSDIRDAVPTLDLFAIRSLRRAGFQIIRQDVKDRHEDDEAGQHPGWSPSPRSSNPAP